MALSDMQGRFTARPIILDATTTSNDENSRLKTESPVEIGRDKVGLNVTMEPYEMRFWSIER